MSENSIDLNLDYSNCCCVSHFNDFEVSFYENSKPMFVHEICLSANAWITQKVENAIEVITEYGLGNWTSEKTIVSVYFHIKNGLKVNLFVKCKVPNGNSKIQFTLCQTSRTIEVEGNHYQWFSVGKFKIIGSGYVKLDMKGIAKSGSYFGDVSHLMFVHKNEQKLNFIRELNSDHIYWSRRGPSIHLSYLTKSSSNEEFNDEFYYNEVTVPKGFDPIGSYFMAIGFDHGYFGIQVNSKTERRVLFSVWSPQDTDDPNELEDENQVQLICKNEMTEHNVFGCEGCGGQSIFRYNWSTDTTYKFLVRGHPDPCDCNSTIYSAWFAPKSDICWKLIASFRRPKTRQYLKGFYSFVESFEEITGFMTRKARFGNQWVRNSEGVWREVTKARITGDSTAQNKIRLDFEGGIETTDDLSENFYLRNCGFFEGNTQLLTQFTRIANQIEPQIDTSILPFI